MRGVVQDELCVWLARHLFQNRGLEVRQERGQTKPSSREGGAEAKVKRFTFRNPAECTVVRTTKRQREGVAP